MPMQAYKFIQGTTKFSPIPNPLVDQEYAQLGQFDVYSLGCTFYNFLTLKYLNGPLLKDTQIYDDIQKEFGFGIADIIQGMTDPDQYLRYTIDEVLLHPALTPSIKKKHRTITDFRM